MPELRRDPLTQRWVVIAQERAKRPGDFVPEAPPAQPSFDPFAEGNEQKTPGEIAAYRASGTRPNTPGWRVRVVPNKFPALRVEGTLEKRGYGIYDRMHGIGAHEIIIETPRCMRSFTPLPDAHVQEILWMYRERLLDLQRDGRMRYGMVFKNVGHAAGGFVYHTHSQLIATPVVPSNVRMKMRALEQYHDFRERCMLCDMLAQEAEQRVRVVMDSGSYLAFAPFAPRFPFETWIVPKTHAARFESLNPAQAKDLAFTLKRTLLKIEKGLNQPPYNFMLFTAPFRTQLGERFHWHLEIIPRLNPVAGFEWGTGFYINPVPPEDGAEFLRNLKV